MIDKYAFQKGDHDAIVADLDLGFQPTPSQAKRPGIRWAHTFSPQDWHELNTDVAVSNDLDVLLIELEKAANHKATDVKRNRGNLEARTTSGP